MTYLFERLPQVVNLRGKLPHDGWYNVYSEYYKTDIAIHHSLTKTGDSRAFAMYHVHTHEWPEVAYHFVILRDGTIEYNHQLGVLSYHVGNSNKQAIGICLVGDFRTQEPTEAQKNSLRELHAALVKDLPAYKRTRGHNEFPGYSRKQCPCFDYEAVLSGKVTGQAQDKGYLMKGDVGDAVKQLQRDLNKMGYKLKVDGSFGPLVEKAVKIFQKGNNLEVDGYYGPATQKALQDAIKRLESKSKEETHMEKNIFVCHSDTDALNAYKAVVRNDGVIKFRANAEDEKVYAEDHVYICGGGKDGIQVGSGKVVDLSGKNGEETSANIDKHFDLI
ncbi:N-acetylmuramoyl-L-alanine amidase [Halobacillus litoralis]|uniref:peptidoglycan recognition protein family protein n=1 Tax=Halobacillus litoralis TaxID=45668 RepID=UPI001CD4BDD5|nr:N-acetylmuramoyl-L-alanine amidase [Halobacillus litoralis]MCA1021783.1 N-acetylmuramoyl-L-alanine amidase [Halobacillus litoralis]